MATTFGTRPEDTVADSRGNVVSGVAINLYPTEADATARTSLVATKATDAHGLWEVSDTADRLVLWARDPSGKVWPVAAEEATTAIGDKADKTYVDTGLAAKADAAQVATDLAAKIDTSVANATFASKGSVPLNVRAAPYNATGDGSTDDSVAIASCLADANTLGRAVYFPAGTYKATIQIPVPAQLAGLDIYGDGVGRTILKAKDASPVVTVGDGGALDAQHITLRDLTIDGNSTATTNVKMNNTRFLELSDVILQGATTYNLWAVGDVANYFGKFHRVRFRTTPINVYLDGGTAGIGGNSNYFDKCHFSGSSNVNYNGAGVAVAVAINGGDSNIFEDCEFVAAGTAIYLHNSAVGNKIKGNQFDGPTTAVNPASAGVTSTQIIDNTGTVVIVDAGTATLTRQGALMGSGTAVLTAGGIYAKPNVVPFTVKGAASASTDIFRVESSAAVSLFRVDQGGNIETGATGAITAHGHSTWDNAVNSSVVMTLNTGGTPSAIGLRLRGNSGQTGDLISFQDNVGAVLGGVGPKGSVRCAKFTTALRPSAVTLGAASMIYDTTLSKPIWSDGTVWRDAMGTAV